MSYILEALKKSDSERQQQPRSLPLKDLAPLASRKRTTNYPLLIPIILVAILLGIAGTFWYQYYLQTQQTVHVDNHVKKETISSPTLLPTEDATEEIVVDIFEPAPILRLPPVNRKRVYVSDSNIQNSSAYMGIAHLKELPTDIQALIPPLKFVGHAYAKEPARRMIIINNKIVREGDTISTGLTLKEITISGVILNYKTILFQIVLDE